MSIRILTGDALATLRSLPAESVHCVVTSPPYYGLRDYGTAGQIGLEASPAAYVDALVAVFREVRRVLRDDGTCWVNLGDSYAGATIVSWRAGNLLKNNGVSNRDGLGAIAGYKPKDLLGIPWTIAFALRDDGWYLRQDIIWAKPNPMPESVTDRCTKAHEYIFLLSKSARYYYDAAAISEVASENTHARGNGQASGGSDPRFVHSHVASYSQSVGRGAVLETRNRRSVWTIASEPFAEAHFATYPPALVEPCILAGTSERGVCAACGAPWVRVVERTLTRPGVTGGATPYDSNRPDGMTLRAGGFGGGSTTTTGWQPSCACNAATVPATVLDPFAGAGTTGLVADRLGRHAVLIELNPSYAAMARRRLVGDAPLLVEIAAE
jgi:site-specific DNA-methyltransferase (adenine-specific)